MKPVFQTVYGLPNGNCFAACIASILEMDLEDVPNFCEGENTNWMFDLNEWLYQFGLGALTVAFQGDIPIKKSWSCAGGKGPTGVKHSVVMKDLEFVHDPHEGWNGFDGDPEDYTFVIVLDPAKFIRQREHARTSIYCPACGADIASVPRDISPGDVNWVCPSCETPWEIRIGFHESEQREEDSEAR